MKQLDIKNIELFSASYDDKQLLIVDHIELQFHNIYGLVGSNMSGRSIFLRLIGGGAISLANWSRLGEYALCKQTGEISHLAEIHDSAVYLGPSPRDSLSTLTNTVAEELHLHYQSQLNKDSNHQNDFHEYIVRSLGLKGFLAQHPMELSEGQTAAVVLASALLIDRPILCIDETLAHLDISLRQTAWRLLKYVASLGKLVLVADNQYDLMAEYSNMTILFCDRRVHQIGTPNTIFEKITLEGGQILPTATSIAKSIGQNKNVPMTYSELLPLLKNILGCCSPSSSKTQDK